MKNILLILTIVISANLFASNNALLDSGNTYYSNGEFEKAITAYETIVKSGLESAELYYNLGNAYYKENNLPYSILNYERAKLLAPDNEDINFNLELTKGHIVDKIDELPELIISSWYKNFVASMSSNSWSVMSIIAFIIFLFLLSVFFLIRYSSIKKISFYLGFLMLVISFSTFIFAKKQKELTLNHNGAIIVTPSVTAKSEPNKNATDLFLIHEGLKVTVTQKNSKWYEIKISDGNIGWVKKDDIVLI